MRTSYILAVFAVLAAVALAGVYTPEAEKDSIDWAALPGTEQLVNNKYRMFSGYIPLGDSAFSKHVFYWFMEAQNNSENAPVVLWTNGGPGCSGFLGLLSEQGPFRPNNDGLLEENFYSWNKIANMLFIEAPAGVGFSYSLNVFDLSTGDNQTAQDNYRFIQNWLNRFPQFRYNDFYITSESYGGHYMPTLAWELIRHNLDGIEAPINFKGFAVGNPYTDAFTNNVAQFEKYWGNQLVSKITYDHWKLLCTSPSSRNSNANQCNQLEMTLSTELGNLNPYALDYPTCSERGQQKHWLRSFAANEPERRLVGAYEPCEQNYLSKYLNRKDVKKAIHANELITWFGCSPIVSYSQEDVQTSTQHWYPKILAAKPDLKILVYSGDDDSVCATVGTQAWIYDIGLRVRKQWSSWTVDDQLAGYVTKFDGNLTFVTVHDAGHEVPTYQPARAFELFKSYLDGTWFQ